MKSSHAAALLGNMLGMPKLTTYSCALQHVSQLGFVPVEAAHLQFGK